MWNVCGVQCVRDNNHRLIVDGGFLVSMLLVLLLLCCCCCAQGRQLEELQRRVKAADAANIQLLKSEEAAVQKAAEVTAELHRLREELAPLQARCM